MRQGLRRIALTLAGLLAFSGIWLTWIATDAATRFRTDPRNVRAQEGSYLPGAGRIITADGVVVATDAADGGRTYPEGPTYAHLIGYTAAAGRRGLEESRYADLRLRNDDSITDWLLGLGGSDGRQPDDVILTVLDPLQQAARDAMSGKTGAVVVLDVATGAVLAYVSSPSYDPNRVAAGTLDPEDAVDAVIDRVADRVLPPGSTFKVIVAAAALDAGVAPSTTFPDAEEYLAPGSGAPIGNAGGGFCGDGGTLTLAEALVVSCNAIFARLAVDLGADPIVRAAEQAGFDAYIPWETGAARSALAASGLLASDPGALAQTGIGERDVRVSPLHMALIAAAIGNEGLAMRPYVVDSIRTASGDTVHHSDPAPLARMFAAGVAADLLEMMQAVVARGTGTAAGVEGLIVSGKTGTSEGSGGPHAWFIGVADDAGHKLAIAVVVESGGSGGRVAAPIAAKVLRAWRDR